MFSHLDFIVAIGTFFIVFTLLVTNVINLLLSHSSELKASELNSLANMILLSLIKRDFKKPVKMGIVSKLYKISMLVKDESGTTRNITVNVSVEFDGKCGRKILNSTVRLYDENWEEIPFKLYNQTFCQNGFLNSSSLFFNISLASNEEKVVNLFFSSQERIKPSNFSIPFSFSTNYTVKVFPLEGYEMLSVDKLFELRGMNEEEVFAAFGNYKFYFEIEGK